MYMYQAEGKNPSEEEASDKSKSEVNDDDEDDVKSFHRLYSVLYQVND